MSHVDDGALHAYLDGELSPVERERLDAHVAECSACRARLKEERGLIERASQLLGFAQPPERAASPPPPLHQLRQPRLLWRIRMPLAWAATVTLALGLGYYLGEGDFMTAGRAPVAALEETPRVDSFAARAEGAQQLATRPPAAPPAARSDRPRRTNAARPSETESGAAEAAAKAEAGVVAMGPPPDVRAVTPTPAGTPPPADAVRENVAPSAAIVASLRGRAGATEWPLIQPGSARRMLGAALVGIPGLPVRDVRRSPAGDGVVLVQQQLDSTTVIQLFQRRVETDAAAAPAPTGAQYRAAEAPAATERLARFIGGLRVEIAGPLTPDSLNKLLDRLEPIP